MTEKIEKYGNGWNKLTLCIMGAITLFSTGWAASSTTAWMDVKRIDVHGTLKTQELEVRVQKLETVMTERLSYIQEALQSLSRDLRDRETAARVRDRMNVEKNPSSP